MKENKETPRNEHDNLLREGRVDEPVNSSFEKKERNDPTNNVDERAEAEQDFKEALTERD